MNGHEKNEGSNYDRISALTTEELDTLLLAVDENDVGLIDTIMEVMSAREAENSTGLIRTTQEAWDEFNTHYRDIPKDVLEELSQEPENTDLALAKSSGRGSVFQWRVVAAVVLIFFSANIVSVSAFGVSIFQLIGTWSSEVFQYNGTPSEQVATIDMPPEAQESLDQLKLDLEQNFLPTWIPERFEYLTYETADTSVLTVFNLYYIDPEECILTLSVKRYTPGEEPLTIYEKDDDPVQEIDVNGIRHYIFNNLDTISATWAVNEYEIFIGGAVTHEEMIDIIGSIYLGGL